MTSLFPRFPSHNFTPFSSDFAPFFRLLDADHFVQPRAFNQSFVPRFDVREVGSTYELQGELPGVKQGDIDIEFVDANTLVIRGTTEQRSTTTSEDSKATPDSPVADDTSEKSSTSYQKATVEDDYVDAGAATEGSETETSTLTAPVQAAQAPKSAEPSYKYWVSERYSGQFERRFNFPGKVDQDAVKASLKDGILSVVVPKAVRTEKKITIE